MATPFCKCRASNPAFDLQYVLLSKIIHKYRKLEDFNQISCKALRNTNLDNHFLSYNVKMAENFMHCVAVFDQVVEACVTHLCLCINAPI